MIEIRTNGGVYLDLAPDAEFDIEMNNPLLESDRIPVAFSTAIPFPPSEVNRRAFGYLPAMLLPPSVMKSGATILFGGIPLMNGVLEYDSVDEDGNLVYTFNEKNVQDFLDTKLYNLDLPKGGPSEPMTAAGLASRIVAGNETGIGAPALYDPEGAVTKYHNDPLDNNTRFTPCISFSRLFSGASFLKLDTSIQGLWGNLSVLGLHKPFTGKLRGYDDTLSIADTLPDISLLDLVKEFCKMTCSAVFVSSGTYRIVPFMTILGSDSVDWDDKIADGHSFAAEKAMGYAFGYSKEDSDNDGVTSSEEITDVSSLKGVLNSGAYPPAVVRHAQTQDIYSVPVWFAGSARDQTCDLLHVNQEEYDTEIDGEKQDNSLSVRMIRNVPIRFVQVEWEEDDGDPVNGGYYEITDSIYRMCGIVSFPADGAERSTETIIGCYELGQLVGKGLGMTSAGNDKSIGQSIDAHALYAQYHEDYEAWLSQDRQVVSVDLALDVPDIVSFRMWKTVCVRNRLFLVKRLTLHLSARMARVLSSCELISL